MLGVQVLCLYLLFGCVIARSLFAKRNILTRIWLGGSMGCVMMMWFPSLFAYGLGFTIIAQNAGLALSGLLALLALWRPGVKVGGAGLDSFPWQWALILLIPMLALTGYLQHTHTLREVDGALHVGQSTYGDLAMHIGFATGLRNASFPPEYTLLPGTRIGYPFLVDALSSTMLLYGSTIRQAFILPSTLMMGLVYLGILLLAYEMTNSKRSSILAFLLFAFNGGLGFIYTLDQVISDPSRLSDALFGFYQTPTNLLDLNLRWSNVIADMMIPQRTLLAGWMMALPGIWLLKVAASDLKNRIPFIMLGIWVGLLPMVHTHSFLAVGLLSLAAFAYSLITSKGEDRLNTAISYILYGAIALLIAFPQLVVYTFPQSIGQKTLAFRFNWVNSEGGSLIDGYFWFWIKNVGLVYLVAFPAFRFANKDQKAFAWGALFIYAVAEFFTFQLNVYDNNKLFYIAFILMLPLIANYLVALFDKLKGFQGRYLLAAAFLFASLTSGALTIAREWISDYQLFSEREAAFGKYVDQFTDPDATFLTGTQHPNPIAVLAGRKIVCGASTYLYFHGVNYQEQMYATYDLYENPADNEALFEQYSVDYAYISNYERDDYFVDEWFFEDNYPLVYQDGELSLYAISERAQSENIGN